MDLCLIGAAFRMGRRNPARSWFSAVEQMATFSYPSPQSGGRQSPRRQIRLVMKKKLRSARTLIIAQAQGRHSSASSSRKSEEKHVHTISPGGITQLPSRFCRRGRS